LERRVLSALDFLQPKGALWQGFFDGKISRFLGSTLQNVI